jgi:hypothetical protein
MRMPRGPRTPAPLRVHLPLRPKCLLIRHDDASREFAYDTGAEKALASVKEHSWTVVSMHNDFKVLPDP